MGEPVQQGGGETLITEDLGPVSEAPVAIRRPDVFYLEPDSPLRADMIEILERRKQGATKMYSRAEVWNE